MMSELLSQGYFALFVIVTIGMIIGHLKIKGFSLDVSAVIFIALIFGHFDIVIPVDFRKIGLVLFIFTIGIQAGPGFFDSFRKHGAQLVITVLALVVSGAILTILLGKIFGIDNKIAVGLLSGALTSTPGLAAAIEASKSSLASIGYGIAYPFGVIGVILFVRLLPRILQVNLIQESIDYDRESRTSHPEISNQNFKVDNINIDGKSIGELYVRTMTGATISRIMHDNLTVTPNPNTVLHLGDFIKAVGTQAALERIELLIGKTTQKEIPLRKGYDVQWVMVTNKRVVNKTLAQLNLLVNYNASVTRIRRSGIDITPLPQSYIRFGDKLMIASDSENMAQVIELLGNEDKRLSETDFLPIALGIVLGVLLGKIRIPIIGGFSFSLGLTGGVLAAALILSRIGKTGPIIWTMSGSANQLLRTLGLLFFLAVVGTEAGSQLTETFVQFGPKLILIGAAITMFPMFVGTVIGRYIFKINFLTILGIITGGMTSTPGLAAIDTMSDSNAPHVAYASVYPVALVCIIIFSQIISRL